MQTKESVLSELRKIIKKIVSEDVRGISVKQNKDVDSVVALYNRIVMNIDESMDDGQHEKALKSILSKYNFKVVDWMYVENLHLISESVLYRFYADLMDLYNTFFKDIPEYGEYKHNQDLASHYPNPYSNQ